MSSAEAVGFVLQWEDRATSA